MVEISLVPEEKKLNFEKRLEHVQASAVKSLVESAHSSQLPAAKTKKNVEVVTVEQNVNPTLSRKVGSQTLKAELEKEEESITPPSISSCTIGKVLEKEKKILAGSRVANKVASSKAGRKGRLQTASSSKLGSGNKVTKLSRSASRSVKPVIRNKGLAKKKVKQDLSSPTCSSSTYNAVNGDTDPSKRKLICERCHCAMNSAAKDSKKGAASQFSGLCPDVNMTNSKSGVNKSGFNVDGKASDVKVKRNTRVRDKGEFSQSSKSSQGEYSSSTTSIISDDSNGHGPSNGNRPHMSKDVRWEAIRHAQLQYGVLSLRHFNLLKKLGCGDIGTVYLAELTGTNCLFAIKVMDNEFLARRKKMPRAQTEREILRMLDHPFLPTLYVQFTSDNLSCLVMEYCPGGDLHVLRQKQLGRVFPEPAAR